MPIPSFVQTTTSCPTPTLAAWSLVQFLALNIFVHILTVPQLPGQTWRLTVLRSFSTLLNPTASAEPLFRSLIGYVRASKRRWRDRHEASWWRRFRLALRADSSMQAAVSAGAVAVPINGASGGWEYVQTTRTLLTHNQKPVNRRYDLKIIPGSTLIDTEMVFPAVSSWVQIIIAMAQICYSSFELYVNHARAIDQQGLSSPYIVVIPYIIGTSLNLLLNLFIGTYPYIVLLPIFSEQTDSMDGASDLTESVQLPTHASSRSTPHVAYFNDALLYKLSITDFE